VQLSEEDIARMREHGLAVFCDRLILEAQPPIDDAQLAAVQQQLSGPMPDGLLQLWRTCFGGELEYDLLVDLGGQLTELSFSELFFPDSDGYFDLWGWMERALEHEAEAAEEEGREHAGKLDFLPFGGFEYLDRLYVQVREGPGHGSVVAYHQGLPPAWKLRAHEDLAARVAEDVPALFAKLRLAQDARRAGADDIVVGERVVGLLDELRAEGEDAALAEKVEAFYFAALDASWRRALLDGSLRTDQVLRVRALRDAARDDDIDALRTLKDADIDLDEALTGGGNALDHAMQCGSMTAVDYLLDEGVTATRALDSGADELPPALAKRLLDAGAEPTMDAVLAATRSGERDTAKLIAVALLARHPEAAQPLRLTARERAADAARMIQRIMKGELTTNIEPMTLRREAEDLRWLADWLESSG
jgi:hypothetical protein